jgi:L-lactate dehydrogenase (cytochrome)
VLQYLGRDASNAYNEVHGPNVVARHLDVSKNKGQLDLSTVTEDWKAKQANQAETKTAVDQGRPPLDAIINLHDFEETSKERYRRSRGPFILVPQTTALCWLEMPTGIARSGLDRE